MSHAHAHAAPSTEVSLKPLDGWHCLHSYYRFDRGVLKQMGPSAVGRGCQELAASLDHPNVVPVYDADESDGVLYIAMRYVEGRDLRDLLRGSSPLPPARAVVIVGQVAAALNLRAAPPTRQSA